MLRVAKNWSQEELAAKCQLEGWDLSRATLSKVEARLRRVTDAEVVILSRALKVKIGELLLEGVDPGEVLRNP